MAAGACVVLREATGGDNDNSATFADFSFDTEVYRDSGSFSLVGSPTTAVQALEAGHHLAIYNLAYGSTGNNRSELTARIEINGAATEPYGWSTGYIRRSGGDNDSAQCAATILDLALNDQVSVARARTDSNTGAPCNQSSNLSGLALIRLDDSWSYFRGRDTTSQSLTHASGETPPVTAASFEWQDVAIRIEDEKGTGFVHSTSTNPAEITIPGATRYGIAYQVKFRNPSGNTRVNGLARLVHDGSQVPASVSTAYARGSNGCQDPVASGFCFFSPTARNKVLKLQAACDQEGTGTLQIDSVAIAIVELPLDVDVAALRQSANHDHNSASFDAISWDTQDFIDAEYSHSTVTNPSRVTPTTEGRHLLVSSFFHGRTAISTARKRPRVTFRTGGSTLVPYGAGDQFNRGDQSSTSTWTAGGIGAAVIDWASADGYIEAGGSDLTSTLDASTAWLADDCALWLLSLDSFDAGAGGPSQTATLDATVPLPTVSASATVGAPPAETGSLDVAAPLPAVAASATVAPPPSETGTLALTAPLPAADLTASVAAPPSESATLAVQVPAPVASLSGELASPPSETASLALQAPLPSASLSAAVADAPSGAATLELVAPLPAVDLSAAVGSPPSVTASMELEAPAPTVSLAGGGTGPESETGALDLEVPAPTASMAATVAGPPSYTATLAASAPAPAVELSGQGEGPWAAALECTTPLPQVSASATVLEPWTATLDAQPPAPVLELAGLAASPPAYEAALSISAPLPALNLTASLSSPGSAVLSIVTPLPDVRLRSPLGARAGATGEVRGPEAASAAAGARAGALAASEPETPAQAQAPPPAAADATHDPSRSARAGL